MSKRGNVTAFVLLTVIVVGAVALYVVVNPSTTADMVLPTPKEYGGAIRGIVAPGTKAFPAGRAIDRPDVDCFSCSCLDQGITSLMATTFVVGMIFIAFIIALEEK